MISPNSSLNREEVAELRHRLRTPVNHILGYAELLLEDTGRIPDGDGFLEVILTNANQILGLVQQHLWHQETEVQPEDVEKVRAGLNPLLHQIFKATSRLAQQQSEAQSRDVARIESAAGELFRFACGESLTLPSRPPATARPYPDGAPNGQVKARFLVVDDTEESREILCRILERQGHGCIGAATGERALELLGQQKFDLVLLDLLMPGMGGVEVLMKIKCDESLRDTAVVMLSAVDEVGQIGRCIELGAEDYLLKPSDRTLIQARLKAVLERKRLENSERRRTASLEAAERELRQSNEELRRFAYAVSHDLQEPLRMVSTYTQLLQRRLDFRPESDEAELMNFVIDGTKRMSLLIADLLAYSQLSTGEQRWETVDCNAIVDEVIANLRAPIEESQASVTHDLLPRVLADAAQIRQLFQNLIGNSLKYRGSAVPQVHVSVERSGRDWLFSVRDNGIGIDPRFAKRIFQMFQRLHDKSVPGTGIGLAICQRVVERLGGTIWVESEPGQGSVFYFTVPEPQHQAA